MTDTTGVGVHVDLGDGSSNGDEVGDEVVDLEEEVGAGGGVVDVGIADVGT